MKRAGIICMIAGVLIILLQVIFFRNLDTSNVVDSRSQTIYINGLRSFTWPSFVGGLIFMAGAILAMIQWKQKGHRVD